MPQIEDSKDAAKPEQNAQRLWASARSPRAFCRQAAFPRSPAEKLRAGCPSNRSRASRLFVSDAQRTAAWPRAFAVLQAHPSLQRMRQGLSRSPAKVRAGSPEPEGSSRESQRATAEGAPSGATDAVLRP